jgi:RNA polymerase sigma factor (sigma-70 family)
MLSTSGRDDLDLILRFRVGDQTVLEDLLRILVPPVRVALRRKFSAQLDYHEIEDVIIVGFRKLWGVHATYDPAKSPLKSFFYQIAYHEAVDTLRRKTKRARMQLVPIGDRVEYAIAGPPASSDGDGEADSDAPRSKLMTDLDTCLKFLTERERKILLADAHSQGGVANSQMLAKELGMSESGVRVNRKRGLDKLRRLLGRLGH